jgi:hypothetical protein
LSPGGEGPKPAWRTRLSTSILDGVAFGEGVAVVTETKVHAVVGGRRRWTRELMALDIAEVTATGCIPVLSESALHCLDAGDGRDRWRREFPDDFDPVTAASDGPDVLVGSEEGTVLRYAGRSCEVGNTPCWTPAGHAPSSGSDYQIIVLADGRRAIHDITRLQVSDRDGKPLSEALSARFMLGATAGPGTTVLVIHEGGVSLLDPANCPFRGDPRPLSECTISTRIFDEDAFDHGPAFMLGDDALLLATAGGLHRWGPPPCWVADPSAHSDPLLVGDTIYLITQDGLGGQPGLAALRTADGRTLWQIRLKTPDRLKTRGGIFLLATPDLVMAITGRTVTAVPRP